MADLSPKSTSAHMHRSCVLPRDSSSSIPGTPSACISNLLVQMLYVPLIDEILSSKIFSKRWMAVIAKLSGKYISREACEGMSCTARCCVATSYVTHMLAASLPFAPSMRQLIIIDYSSSCSMAKLLPVFATTRSLLILHQKAS
uniref:Uncharacterized protein n=1 Tax=viral metagenome TaxID=1070528 RepID=A0A6C0C2H5_9ZZZZ